MLLFKSNQSRALVLVFFYFFSVDVGHSASLVAEKKVMKNLILAVDREQWKTAEELSKKLNEPAVKTFISWVKLRKGFGSFGDYQFFLSNYSHWPGLQILKQKGEAKISKKTTPKEVITYFNNSQPSTGFGAMCLINAYQKIHNNDAAVREIKRAWSELSFKKNEFTFFITTHGSLTVPFVNERSEFLLWNGMTREAKRLLPYLSKDTQALAKARISLRQQNYGVDVLIKKVPPNLKSDPGLAYERFLWRVKKGRSEGAKEILTEQSISKSTLSVPSKWSRKRRDYARQAMRDNKPELAYFLASNHFVLGGSDYADLEWLSGYISLRKLNKPAQAIAHFNNFLNAVKTPISLGRAGYWLGRAHEEINELRLARYYYRLGAQNQSSFYGQLSAEKIGAKLESSLVSSEINTEISIEKFDKTDTFRLAVLFYESNADILSKRFFLHFAEGLNVHEHRQLADYLLNQKSEFLALAIAKQAATEGRIYSNTYYPVHELAKLSWKIRPEILLAIARRESEFNLRAKSGAGARGFMQIMPGTAKKVSADLNYKYSSKRLTTDWEYNVELGAEYLNYLMGKYDGSFLLSFGAYNAGPTRMDSWVKRYGDPRNKDVDYIDWIEHIPFNETRNYIMRVLEGVLIYRAKLHDNMNSPVKIRLTRTP